MSSRARRNCSHWGRRGAPRTPSTEDDGAGSGRRLTDSSGSSKCVQMFDTDQPKSRSRARQRCVLRGYVPDPFATFRRLRGRRLGRRHQGRRLTRKEVRQFVRAVTRSEDRATWLQGQPGFEVPGIDGVESEAIYQLKHHSNRRGVIAGGRHGNAVRRAVWTSAFLELEVAELIEALHNLRGGEPLLYERARARRCSLELLINAVDLVPVVHAVDEDLPAEQSPSKFPKAVQRYRQDDDTRVSDHRVS